MIMRDGEGKVLTAGNEYLNMLSEYFTQDQVCYKCEMKRHWSCIYRTPKHFADLYQEHHGQKKKKIQHEANYVENRKLEVGKSSKTNEDNKPKEKDPKEIKEKTGTTTEDDINLKGASNSLGELELGDDLMEEDGLLAEELQDMHGDSI